MSCVFWPPWAQSVVPAGPAAYPAAVLVHDRPPAQIHQPDIDLLERVQDRVLWLATSMVHHANKTRPSRSGIKVGGHQASSASMVGIMVALWFEHLRAGDRVSVKPHAAPVLHAINYLTGRLEVEYLPRLREYGGLQSYPSRTKDPDPVDFSTGSVGIGATATIWSALAHRYVSDHFDVAAEGRHIALLGDAELDEGAVWEALVDPMVSELGEVLWVVDLNRQSLDRIVPGVAARRIEAMFEAVGWNTITLKYGRKLRAAFAGPGGEALERRLDAMSNEEYQWLLRSPAPLVRERLAGEGPPRSAVLAAVRDVPDEELGALVADLGGHDLQDLVEAYAAASEVGDRPSVVLAYTIKAWGLPTRGHPSNHSSLLTEEQWRALAGDLGADPTAPWAGFEPGSTEAALADAVGRRLARSSPSLPPAAPLPAELGRSHTGAVSTQAALGRLLADVARAAPAVAERIVTVSPDVASSTNLGTWINKVGIWTTQRDDAVDWFADDDDRLVRWRESGRGQHIELGIAEVNLVGMLGELGLTGPRHGQPLIPLGTIYDPFVTRALEPWSFGLYAGGRSILVGTPSGVTLAPEGGAHQSTMTPSIGIEQPRCTSWEPAFAQDLEWCLLEAMESIGRADGESAYLRLSTRPIDQALAAVPSDAAGRSERRRQALAGGYVLRASERRPQVALVGVGVVLPEVCEAADVLASDGVSVDVICLTSPDLLHRAARAQAGLGTAPTAVLDLLFPADRSAPIVTVIDGHAHSLAFLGSVRGVRCTSLGVDDFGQVGEIDDLYRHFGIDAASITGAAWDLLDEAARS